MASLNKVILIGHFTADPELKQTSNSVSVVSFTLGVQRKYKTGDQPQSDFITCVAWNRNAEFICKYFKKGNAICVCGSIQTRSYDGADGTKRYSTEVIVDEATFVEKKEKGDDYQSPAFSSEGKSNATPNFQEVSDDEEIPF